MYVKVKDLPDHIRRACKLLGHNRESINCVRVNEVSKLYHGNTGARGVFRLVSIESGVLETVYGSWGGPSYLTISVWLTGNPVDEFEGNVELPDGIVALKGSTGHLNLLTLYASESTMAMLPQGQTEELTSIEKVVLYAHASLKGGKYRKEFYQRHRMTAAQLDLTLSSLAGKELIKINKAGASSITTNGRNAIDGVREWDLKGEQA